MVYVVKPFQVVGPSTKSEGSPSLDALLQGSRKKRKRGAVKHQAASRFGEGDEIPRADDQLGGRR